MRRLTILAVFFLLSFIGFTQTATYEKSLVSSRVWSNNPVIATSTQQNGMAIYENYVYMVFYNTDRNLCVARNSNYGVGTWVTVVLPHLYEQRQLSSGEIVYDNHNTPNIAISPNDKRIHLAFDMHAHDLRYIISDANAAIASDANFTASLFSSTRNYLQSNLRAITNTTYPRFFVGADNKLFIMYRVGGSGSGDTFLGEYKDDGFWFSPGKLISRDGDYNGSTTRCAYFNNVHYEHGKIYLTWVWRESPAADDNHDLMFAYSDDNGVTWKNSAGTSLSIPISVTSPGINVATIPTGSGLTNHNGCTVDGHGNVHVTHRISGAYKHYVGVKDGDTFNWSNGNTITTFTGDRSKVYADKKTNDLYFLVRHGTDLKMFTTASNGELWNQWTQKIAVSDGFITSGNSVINAAGDKLTSMTVSSDDRLQIIRWSLSTNSPDIVPKVTTTKSPSQVYSFDTDGDLEGFTTAGTNQVATVANGALKLSWTEDVNAPYIKISGLSLASADYPKVLIRLKNNNSEEVITGGASANCARFIPYTDGLNSSGALIGNKYFNLFHTASDAEFSTYIIDLGADPNKYGGTLSTFQFQGVRNTIAASSIEVAEIRLIGADNSWTGNVSTDWEVSGNWSQNTVPAGEIVTIPGGGNQPVISSANAIVADLNLQDGAVVSVSNNTTLTVLSNVITTGSGHVEVASGSSLVTYGTVAGTGHVFNRTTTFNSSTGKYSVVGAPVSGASTSALGSLVYRYDESVAYGANGSGRFTEVTSPETMTGGDAYFSAYTGDVTFTGTPHTGNVTVPLTYNAGDGGNAGFNLVSNPYPTAIDFSKFVNATTNPDIDGTIYLWDDGGSNTGQRTNGDYITINSIGVASAGSGRSGSWNTHLGSAQGFLVKANKASGSLSFNNEMKAVDNNASANYFRAVTGETSDIQSLKLSLKSTSGFSNQSLIGFVSDATDGFDRMYDAHKMDGSNGLKLYSLLEEQPMAIQGLPLADESIIPLGITLEKAGEYTINLDYLKNWTEGKIIYLEDMELNQVINLSTSGKYNFSGVAGTNEKRFKLIVSNVTNVLGAEVLGSKGLDIHYQQNGLIISSSNAANKSAQVSIFDLSGAVHFNKVINSLQRQEVLDFQFESKRVYMIKVTTKSDSYLSKIVFE